MLKLAEHPNAEVALDQVQMGGELLNDGYRTLNLDQLGVRRKPDGTEVTDLDIEISNVLIANIHGATGEKVVTEEIDDVQFDLVDFATTEYKGTFWIQDPLDHTKDVKAGIEERPIVGPGFPPRRPSTGAVTLARIQHRRLTTGALGVPLIEQPKYYVAEKGYGALVEQDGRLGAMPMIDTAVETGIVLVSENDHPYIEELKKLGLVPLGLGGIAFKLACVFDASLIHACQLTTEQQSIVDTGLPIVALASDSSSLYDHAGGIVIAKEVGASYVMSPNGERPQIAPGKQGIIVAHNRRIGRKILQAMQA